MKAQEMIDSVAEVLQEDFNEPQVWTKSEILNYIDIGQKKFAKDTLLLERLSIERTFTGKTIYELINENITPCYIAYDNQEIDRITPQELDILDSDWLNTQGAPSSFYQKNLGLHKVGIYPSPNTDGSEVKFEDSYGVVRKVDINGMLQTFNQNYGVVRYLTYNNGEIYWLAGGVGDPRYSNPFGEVQDIKWSRSNLFYVSKVISDTIDTTDDSLSVNEHFDFVIRDYTLFQAFLREGDGKDTE